MAQTLLTDDLNIIANSDLEIIPLEQDLAIIQKLDDEPNDVGGMTAAQLKAKFDESGLTIQRYINESLIPQILENDATEAARNAAEEYRQEQELLRQHAEGQREIAEAQREENERARADETAGVVAQAAAQVELAKAWAEQSQKAAASGTHAHLHSKDGDDPLTPEMIGACSKEEMEERLESLTPGLLPQIIATASDAYTVTCTKGDIVLQAKRGGRTWTFDVPEYGDWTMTFLKNGTVTLSKVVSVTSVQQYFVNSFYAGYTPLEYIEGDGNQYFGVENVIIPENATFRVTFEGLAPQNMGYGVVGGGTAGNYPTFLIDYSPSEIFGRFGTDNQYYTFGTYTTGKHTIYVDSDRNIYLDGTSCGTLHEFAEYTISQFSICAQAGDGIFKGRPFIGKFYEFILMTADGEEHMHFYAARRDSDEVIGLYESVNDIFYTNKGTGTFIAGPEIV